jgi:hypothetical protein
MPETNHWEKNAEMIKKLEPRKASFMQSSVFQQEFENGGEQEKGTYRILPLHIQYILQYTYLI